MTGSDGRNGMKDIVRILELTFLMQEQIGFNGELVFNTPKPNGTMHKLIGYMK
jgi:hypothetical protein